MTCVILQPSYIPWRGYFHQIQKADVFVFYDDANYDKHGWRNRNRVKTFHGAQWLTIPVTAPQGRQLHETPINEVRIDRDRNWDAKHWKTLAIAYSKAPFYKQYAPLLEPHYHATTNLLAEFTIAFTKTIAAALGITTTRFLRSSEMAARGRATERLTGILRELGADHYVSGPSARNYLDEMQFSAIGATVEYMRYEYAEYPQLYPPFDPALSILDLLFMCGPDSPRYIWGNL